ncbi:hypothetical protein HHK36_004414 [Tetracentron sinense]|uniref:Uncharacterized protein n=1 Tax=Tetracentron sinense TaxID=13715 RepID=A0A834ZUE1_TETSI|nr:hypothetical protein HHK36_004414 [Tetracentron sinense]
MAPKKKQQQKQKAASSFSSSSSSQSKSKSSGGPKLQISAENEQRLRRLLLSSGRPTLPPSATPADETISKSQKAKRLRSIYEKLSCEGFTDDQIERALSALIEGATFEAALDWLCLNIPGNELPSKFSSGTSMHTNEGGSISIISTAREDWVSSPHPSAKIKEQTPEISVRIKGHRDEETLDSLQPSQADWIRQYMEQQEEDDLGTWEGNMSDRGSTREVSDPNTRAVSIAEEYRIARLEATDAKERGDKKTQERAGHIIRKLKQEMSALGLADDILASGLGDERSSNCASDISYDSVAFKPSEAIKLCDAESGFDFVAREIEPTVDGNDMECCNSKVFSGVHNSLSVPIQEKFTLEDEEPEDVELGNLFSEDASSNGMLPPEVLKLQKKEKISQLSSGQTLEKIDGIWRKGDPRKIPKAVLHQLCQRFGWEAPKFNKVTGKENRFFYAVSVLRTASGRGKSRKTGGLITLQLPDENETFESAEDAQNRVAAFALYRLFPDLPVHQLVTEPYSSFVTQWQEGESLTKIEDSEEIRRAGFVDSLLSADNSGSTTSRDVTNLSLHEKLVKSVVPENIDSAAAAAAKVERMNRFRNAESSYLREEQENKMKMRKYKDMLEARAALPIAELKGDILQLLKENNVLVVCGETGCGKTTQGIMTGCILTIRFYRSHNLYWMT